jgi:hypothetical protein
MMIGTVQTMVLDASDIARLSAFNTALAGWTQKQAHFDLRMPDVAAAARAVELGPTLLRENETGHTLADPTGKPFCLLWRVDLWRVD